MADLATQLIGAHRAGQALAPEGAQPATLTEAFAVQARVSAAFGAVGGFKVARSGAETIHAPIRADRCHASGAALPGRPGLMAEVEVGWRILSDLPAPGEAGFARRLAAAVRPLPVIELCGSRLRGPAAGAPLMQLADGLSGWGLVCGAPLAAWDGQDFSDLTLTAAIDGATVFRGPVRVPGGSALNSLAALLGVIGGHCGGVRPGQTVITGSLLPPVALPPGARLSAEIGGLGAVAVG